MIGLELVGGLVAQRLVQPDRIVKGFDVLEHAQPGSGLVFEGLVVGPLVFQRPEEALHRRVIVARATAAHRALDAQSFQVVSIRVAGVLTTAVAGMQELLPIGPSRFNRLTQGLADQFGGQRRAHRPAHHLATEQGP